MDSMKRFAIYYAPPAGGLSDFGAAWLGWDPATGSTVAHPDVAGLPRPVAELTGTPRKYGFHGTLKPPFRLAQGQTADALADACAALASRIAPFDLQGLRLARLGGFLALVPEGDAAPLAALAAACVRDLDPFRAPPTGSEIARRAPDRLSPRQRELLDRWGYPYVMEEFRFHLTLSGKLDPQDAAAVEAALAPVVAPLLPRPFPIGEICLFGEDGAGMFHILRRFALRA
ncbi:DUF1045 domain-containing protein [Halovulum dunhuangense]|uniref:DUF1045 domain-containing protein n=1 Tax=Halovulum dunhuangense TaxID=1505036 RepID=A0A849L266_9RHOB|nr:DUF1045 domain-containing protein [Halovulum dunhuangense]NNU80359.1 DUF1045 domain-containing protein [Halovulum dunhuangense]